MTLNSIFKHDNLIFLSGLMVGLAFFVFPLLGFDLKYFPGDFGDSRLNIYFLEHSYKFLTFKLEDSFWDAPFMYPAKGVLAYSDNLLGSAPIYGFFRLLGFNIFTSFQWWYIAVSVLNYYCAYVLIKYLFKNSFAAVLGAMIFAFSVALISQLAHAQMFPRFGIPLAFLMAVKFYESLSTKHFFWMIFFTVFQFYCGIYLGFFLLLPVAFFGIYTFVKKRNELVDRVKTRPLLFKLFLGLVFNALMLTWLIYPYVLHSKNNAGEPYDAIFSTLPNWQSYLLTGGGSLLWDRIHSINRNLENWWDFEIFPGAIALLGFTSFVIIVGYRMLKKKSLNGIVVGLVITAALTFLFFLREGDQSMYFFIYQLPGYGALRSMSRIINVQLLFFGVGTAYVISLMLKEKSGKNTLIFYGLLSLLTLDNYNSFEGVSRREKAEGLSLMKPLEDTFDQLPTGSVVSYEPRKMINSSPFCNISAMLASQKNNIKVLNGYTAGNPEGYKPYRYEINEQTRKNWLSMNQLNFDTLYVVNGNFEVTVLELFHEAK